MISLHVKLAADHGLCWAQKLSGSVTVYHSQDHLLLGTSGLPSPYLECGYGWRLCMQWCGDWPLL